MYPENCELVESNEHWTGKPTLKVVGGDAQESWFRYIYWFNFFMLGVVFTAGVLLLHARFP